MLMYWKSSYSMLLFFYFILMHYAQSLLSVDCCLLTIYYILLPSLGNTIEGLCFLASSKSIEQ